jgi:hypothetical protein
MARIETDPNYTTPTFSRATAATDLFKKEDVQLLAAAMSTHDHTNGRGARLTSGAFTGAVDLPDWYRSTGHASVFATSGAGAELYYDGAKGVVQGWNRATNAQIPFYVGGAPLSLNTVTIDVAGNLTVPGTASVSGTLTVSGNSTLASLSVSGNSSIGGTEAVAGTLTALGALNANGVVTLGNTLHLSNHPIDGVSALTFQSGANLTATSDHVQAVNHLDVSFDLLVSRNAQISGNATVGTTLQIQAGRYVPYTSGGVQEHFARGSVTLSGITNNTGQNLAQTFPIAFSGTPSVMIGIGTPTTGDVENWSVAAQFVSTTGFTIRAFNASGSTGNVNVYWLAMGQ